MKIKQQLPPLIRGNSRQAGVTKAEQEKPLTANHCIDPRARPLTTSRSTAPRPPPLLPSDLHVYCGSSAFMQAHAHTCTRAQTRSTIFISIHAACRVRGSIFRLRSRLQILLCGSYDFVLLHCQSGNGHPHTPTPHPQTPQWRST